MLRSLTWQISDAALEAQQAPERDVPDSVAALYALPRDFQWHGSFTPAQVRAARRLSPLPANTQQIHSKHIVAYLTVFVVYCR